MEYAYHYNIIESINGFAPNYNSRIILAKDDIVAEKMKQSVLSAINNRWNSVVFNPQWKINSGFLLNKSQRFKTKLKKGIPGSWHLFFQVIDNGPYVIGDENSSLFRTLPSLETLDNARYHMEIKALIVDGSNESVIFSNEMTIELQRTVVPVGQLLLRKVPALTDSFLQAFDSAVQNFFSNSPQKDLKLEVTPACLFLDVDKTVVNSQKLNFITKNDSVIEQLQLKKEWIIQSPNTQKTKRKNNFGNNLFNTSFTLLTGMETDKIREMGYQTTFGFVDVNEKAQYVCKIPFTEQRREGKSREVTRDSYGNKSKDIYLNGESSVSRLFDPKQIIYLVREKDTIGSFKITIGNSPNYKNRFSQCWDGKNESTLTAMPETWFNTSYLQNRDAMPYILEGELYNVPFAIEKSMEGNQLDITIKNQDTATLKIYNSKPVLGLLYSPPTDEKVFSVLMMLSTMPFNSIL
ncbi:MAG: hypothetical protein KA188_08025 [Leadbetterella sp.]|nr:hypothetical protein [Leadbetterella sp.]